MINISQQPKQSFFTMKTTLSKYLFGVVLCFLLANSVMAQTFKSPFQFTIPLKDSLSSVLQLTSSLLKPITATERLRLSNDGHFVTTSGERVRLFGPIVSYTACYPDSADAILLAKRLQQLGYNAVKFHGWDVTATWGTILPNDAQTTSAAFNESEMKRMDWFIYQLKQHGVYVYLNNVGYTPRSGDGITDSDSIQYSWSVRAIQYASPAYQDAHLRFLKRFFNRVNPYTKVAYKDEPTLALFQCTDENSLLSYWNNNFFLGTPNRLLSQRQVATLDTLFNLYLIGKYGNNNALRQAWTTQPTNTNSILKDGGFEDVFSSPWQLNTNDGGQAVISFSDADKVEGTQSVRIRIGKPVDQWYQMQFSQAQVPAISGKQYELTFSAKTTVQQNRRFIVVGLIRNENPYNSLGLYDTVYLSPTWNTFSLKFTMTDTYPNSLLMLGLGGSSGDVFFDNVNLKEITLPALAQNESLNSFSVKRNAWGDISIPTQRLADNSLFYTWLAETYFVRLKRMLQDTLKSSILVGGDNVMNYLNDVYATKSLDFTSANAGSGYLTQYESVDKPWYVYNQSSLETNWGGAIFAVSRAKVSNKPLVVCRYITPYPSRFINETMTYAPAYFSFQDYDAFFISEWQNNRYNLHSSSKEKGSFWSMSSMYSLDALAPMASYLFRNGLVRKSEEVIKINQSLELLTMPQWQNSGYFLKEYADSRIPFFRRIELDSFDSKVRSFLPHLVIPEYNNPNGINMKSVQTDTKELTWNQEDGWMKINTPRCIGYTGKANTGITDFDTQGSVITAEQQDSNPMCTYYWVSKDSLPIAQSKNSLIALVSRQQNAGAVWDGDNSVWKNWGTGAVQIEALNVRYSVRSLFDSLLIYPLDSLGKRIGTVIRATKSNNRFSFILDQAIHKTVWFEVEQKNIPTSVSESLDEALFDIYPNPASDMITLLRKDDSEAVVRIESIDGRAILEKSVSGLLARISVSTLPSGVYSLTLRSGINSFSSKITIIR
jgi:hypothetical protein